MRNRRQYPISSRNRYTWGAPAQPQCREPAAHLDLRTRYSFEPAEITVRKGQAVTLELTSTDVTHGLAVKELGIKTDIKKGKTTEVSFTRETVGTFISRCSHFSGAGHSSMRPKIHVIE